MSDLSRNSFHDHLSDNTENRSFGSSSSRKGSLSYEMIYKGYKETNLLLSNNKDILTLSAIDKGFTPEDIPIIKKTIERIDATDVIRSEAGMLDLVNELVKIETEGNHMDKSVSSKPIRIWPESVVRRVKNVDFSGEDWKRFLGYLNSKLYGSQHAQSKAAIRSFITGNARSVGVTPHNKKKS